MIRTLTAASALAGSLFALGVAQAATPSPFSGETVFGDSLSDSGNISILTGLPSIMRFTTNPGFTAVEDVGNYFGLATNPSLRGGTDFAYGGAGVTTDSPGTPSLIPTETQQITAYLAANPKLSGSELYTVFAGANDIFYHGTAVAAGQFAAAHSAGLSPSAAAAFGIAIANLEGVAAPETPDQASTAIQSAAAQEVALIGDLQKAGARYIVVFNLPNTSRTPAAASGELLVPGTIAEQSTLSTQFNGVLNAGLASAGVGIIPVNTFALFNEVLANPAAYGISNTTVPACTTSSSLNCTPQTLRPGATPQTYLFADSVHPTTNTHALFAQVVENEIIAPQQVSLLAEEPLATLEAERNAIGQQLLSDQAAPSPGVHLFAAGGYVRQHISAQSYTPSAHDDDGLITAGVEDQLNATLTLGAELSGGTASEALDGQLRRFDTDSFMGSLFAQYVWRQAYVDGAAGYGGLRFRGVQRDFKIGPVTRTEDGETQGQTASLNLGGGYWFGAPRLRAGPFVTGAYERVHVDRYAELSADSESMTFGSQTRESLIGEAGVRVQGALPFHTMQLRPYAEVGYAYDGDARTRDVVAGLTTMAGQFAIPGFSPDRQWGVVQAGLNAAFSDHWSGYVAYNGRFAGATTDYYGGNIGVKYAF